MLAPRTTLCMIQAFTQTPLETYSGPIIALLIFYWILESPWEALCKQFANLFIIWDVGIRIVIVNMTHDLCAKPQTVLLRSLFQGPPMLTSFCCQSCLLQMFVFQSLPLLYPALACLPISCRACSYLAIGELGSEDCSLDTGVWDQTLQWVHALSLGSARGCPPNYKVSNLFRAPSTITKLPGAPKTF